MGEQFSESSYSIDYQVFKLSIFLMEDLCDEPNRKDFLKFIDKL